MNKLEKLLVSISLSCMVAFIVIFQVNALTGFSGEGWLMDSDEFEVFWWASFVVVFLGALICIKDIKVRFEVGADRTKWYLLFLFVGTFAYPYYFFKYGIKPRKQESEDA